VQHAFAAAVVAIWTERNKSLLRLIGAPENSAGALVRRDLTEEALHLVEFLRGNVNIFDLIRPRVMQDVSSYLYLALV
jgi:hypothetical protein